MKKIPNIRRERIQRVLSKISGSIALLSLSLWTYLTFRLARIGLSKKEILSLVILMSNDCLRIGLAVVEQHTSRFLSFRAIPLIIQILLIKRNVIQKLVRDRNREEWIRLLQFVFYANLTMDVLLTLVAGLFMFDSRIVVLAFLEMLLI